MIPTLECQHTKGHWNNLTELNFVKNIIIHSLSITKTFNENKENVTTSRSAALLDGVHAMILLECICVNICRMASTAVIVLPVPEK